MAAVAALPSLSKQQSPGLLFLGRVPQSQNKCWIIGSLTVAAVAALPSLSKQQSPGLLFLGRVPQFQNKCWIIGSLIVAAVAALPSLSKQQSLRIIVSRQSATDPYIQLSSRVVISDTNYSIYLLFNQKNKKNQPLILIFYTYLVTTYCVNYLICSCWYLTVIAFYKN